MLLPVCFPAQRDPSEKGSTIKGKSFLLKLTSSLSVGEGGGGRGSLVCRLPKQENISEDTQEMPQSRSAVLPRHQKKER